MRIPRSVFSSLLVLSLAAFCLGLVLHGLTYFGIDPRTSIPTIWYSFQLITALAVLPAIISFRRRDISLKPGVHSAQTYDRFATVLGWVVMISISYAVFDFLFTGIGHLYNEAAHNEAAYRSNYRITKTEFIKYSIYWARVSSVHWMALCSFIAMELYHYLIR
jgi:hypothetical protein